MRKWTELRTIVELARLETVSAASEVLNLRRATVIRHVDTIEEELGVKVFLRSNRGYKITEAGGEVLKVARATEQLTTDLKQRMAFPSSGMVGALDLVTLATLMHRVTPVVFGLQLENIGLKVKLQIDTANFASGKDDAHLVISGGPKFDSSSYLTRTIGHAQFNLFGAKSYFEEYGYIDGNKDVSRNRFVNDINRKAPKPYAAWFDNFVDPKQIALETYSPSLSAKAVSKGVGLGFFLTESPLVKEYDLLPALAPQAEWTWPIWVAIRKDVVNEPNVKQFLTKLVSFGLVLEAGDSFNEGVLPDAPGSAA